MSKEIGSLQVLKSFSDATSELIKKLTPSVVSVNSRMTRGTGIVLTSDGYIATCNHVLGRSSDIRVGSGQKTYEAHVIGSEPYSDVAVLKAKAGDFEPIEFADSDKVSTGQFVLAIANPFNRGPAATTGIVTNVGVTLRGWRGSSMENVIATDARLNPGFSGGPLIDVSGRVIGLNSAYVWSRGIAIPSNKVKSITDRLMAGGKLRRAYLGIVSDTVLIPPEIASQLGIDQESGVMVFQVERETPAKEAGIIMGDVIVSFNKKPVATFYDLPRLLNEDIIGKETNVQIIRGEQLMQLTIVPKTAVSEDDD
jgi:S1-C subfamily serine protease